MGKQKWRNEKLKLEIRKQKFSPSYAGDNSKIISPGTWKVFQLIKEFCNFRVIQHC
jgi:hypothetical protein